MSLTVRRKKNTGRSRLVAWIRTKPESVFHPTDAAKALGDLAVAKVHKYLRELAREGFVFPIQDREDGNWRRCVEWDPEPEPEPVERKAPAENSVRVAKRRAHKLAAEVPRVEIPYELKSKILKSFGDSEAQREFRKRIESRKDRIAGRSGNRGGTILNMNVEETLLEVFLRNREGGGGLPDHDNPNNVRECLDDMQLARWLVKEFPQNRRNYNSWLKFIPPIRSVYHRGKLVMQLRDEKGGVGRPYPLEEVLESPQYVAGEPQPIIRRPRRRKSIPTTARLPRSFQGTPGCEDKESTDG